MRVYIAGPMTQGDDLDNLQAGLQAGNALMEAGHAPFVPQLSYFWHAFYPHTWNEWLDMDLEWINVCDAVLRLPGRSRGARKEVLYAKSQGIPIFYVLEELLTWASHNKIP